MPPRVKERRSPTSGISYSFAAKNFALDFIITAAEQVAREVKSCMGKPRCPRHAPAVFKYYVAAMLRNDREIIPNGLPEAFRLLDGKPVQRGVIVNVFFPLPVHGRYERSHFALRDTLAGRLPDRLHSYAPNRLAANWG